MCRKFFLLTSFLLVLALTTGVSNAADPFLQADDADGIVSMEAERFHDNVAQGDHMWEMVTATDGFTGLVGMQSLPNSGDNVDAGYVDNSPHVDFQITFVKTGTHYVWLRAWGSGGSDDSCHVGLDGQVTDSADRIDGFSGDYTWTNHTRDPDIATIDITDVGVHTLNLYMREDGAIVDKIVLTTNPDYIPEGDGPAESPGGGTGPVQAFGPVPADGAVEVDTMTLEWIAGYTAVSHKVYLSTDETIDESDFLAEGPLALQFADLAPGTNYYWRVDEVDADGAVHEGEFWSFSTLPIEAHFPDPEDGAENVSMSAKLSWTAGKNAIMHDVYFGTDEAAVAASDPSTFQGKLMDASFDPGPLDPFMTYYWKVDEFAIIVTNPGPVWSFSTPKYLVISDDETTLDYDNSVDPFVTEVAFDTPQDLTVEGLADLTLRFHGGPGPEGSVSLDEATGTYEMTGSGADVWGEADQFHYGYRELTGDAEISARVVSNGTGSNEWAKGGVMIRETLDADSKHTIMALTGGSGGGITFQSRPETGGGSISMHDDITASPPHWVKLTRAGNTITAYHSADGVTWDLFTDTATDGAITNPMDVEMADPVLIGLFVTSHAAGEKRTYTFDNVDIVGNISADDASTDVGIPFNTPEPIYVALEDSTGAVASVTHPDPEATLINTWRDWRIPLSEFAGVDPTNAAKLYIGVGDGQPGGSGSIRVDDIRVVMPTGVAMDNWVAAVTPAAPGFLATNIADGLYDIGTFSGDMTYEFVVRSNPDETENSMCLIGRRWFGETEVGLKYEQNPNTGTYGATTFGVTDFDYGIATNPGVDTHLVFVSSEDAGTTALYVNGVYQASIASAITLFGNVGIGLGAQAEDGSDTFDNFDGDIFGVAIFDTALSDSEIAAHSDAFFGRALKINFQQAGGEVPEGYLPDYGEVFGDRGNGFSYGWNMDLQGNARDRGIDPDQRYDTLNHLQQQDDDAIWEIELPNGAYELFLVCGDPGYEDQTNSFDVEGVIVEDLDPQEGNFDEYNVTAVVKDGALTIKPAPDSVNCKIMFVHITAVPAPPVGHWTLDDGEGTIAVDSSGNGNDGVLMGDPQWAAGIIGGALDFDGDGDYVDCGYDPLFDITGEITVAAWLNIRSIPTAWTAAVAKGENAWRLSNVNVDPRFHFGITWWDNPDLASVDGATAVGFDEWHHATGTFDGANINVYLDGVLDGSALTTEPLGISTTNLFIGLNPESPGTFWDGLIDDVKIFDRALSADEILELAGEPEAAPAGFSDDFNRPDGDVGNGWETQTDGTITVQIVDNEVLIAGTQATDWARCGISRPVGDESMVSCDFMMPGGFNFHIRVDDADTDAYFEVYTWGGNLDHANSEDGGWPGWVAIPNASPIADVYNNIMLELIGNEITVTLNDTVVGTFTNANLTNIESVLICSDSAADTTGSLIIDNVVFSSPGE